MTHQKKNWIDKHMLAGGVYLAVVFGLLIAGVYYWQYSSTISINQIIHDSNLNCNELVPVKARNKYTGEIKEFSNSCKFPRGWETVIAADLKGMNQVTRTYRNEDYGFELKLPSDTGEINYQYNGKVDYVSIFVAEQSNAILSVYPQGSADLLLPDATATESAFSTIGGKAVRVKKWNLTDGRILVRYVFTDKVNNWSSCSDTDEPNTSCNRIDLYAGNQELMNKLVNVISNISFFPPKVAAKTTETVYYYADNRLRIYNPNSGSQSTRALSGLENFATLKKNGNNIVYLSNDQVSIFNLTAEETDVLFAKNTENGITYIPDNFAISPDKTKVAIGYRYGTAEDLNNCKDKCSGVKAGIIIVDLYTGLTKASFDLSVQATPVRWIGSNIALSLWSTSKFTAVSENGQINSGFVAPADLIAETSTSQLMTDSTKAVDIRTQKDRFGQASYLFVNGKSVYKTALGSISLVTD